MKKIIAFFLLVTLAIGFGFNANAQGGPVPVDKDLRIGKLDNGLTYYIRHNEKPKGQADFYIAQKVGSILEDDTQRGLAHFLEHMCFNGTTNFPGNSLIDWLETKGVKFGYNLNAYTSIDETVYNISNVPVANEAVVDSCLLILHDWADNLLLEDAEIDKERNVIHQEWRRSMVGQMRILEELLPKIFPSSPYGERLPIGTMEVVDNFPYQKLRDYYEAWYRPDQQGILVVGDIDPDAIEAKIKEVFSPIKMPANAPERVYFPVQGNKGTIIAAGKDKEQARTIVELIFKVPAFPNEMKNDASYLMTKYMFNIIADMLSSRLNEMSSKPDAPFAAAGASFDNFILAKTMNSYTVSAIAKTNDPREATEALYREILRMKRGGFTASEYERARAEYLSRLEKAYETRAAKENGSYVREYVRHFIDNEPIPGIEFEYNLMSSVAPAIGVNDINQVIGGLIGDDNRVLMVLQPDAEDAYYPTDEEYLNLLSKVDGEQIEGYLDEVKTEPLIPVLPKPGKIKKTIDNPQWGATEYVLSNGVKVVVKKTDFKPNEIKFSAIAKGGTSIVGEDLATELVMLPYGSMMRGLGSYTNSDLEKYMQGKQASVSVDLSSNTRTLSGTSTVKDLPTFMELLYMTFVDYQLDANEFESLRNMLKGVLANQESTPDYKFGELVSSNLYKSAANALPSVKHVESMNREKMLNIYHSQLANAADFTFFFVGDIDTEKFIPLMEQYIATLPANPKKVRNILAINPDREVNAQTATTTETFEMQTPQTYALIFISGIEPYSSKNSLIATMSAQILSNRLLKTIREDMGAVYSIGASGRLSRTSPNNAAIQMQFPMKPEMKNDVLAAINKMVYDMTQDVTEAELAPIQEYMVKNAIENREDNDSWLGGMSGEAINGVDTFNGQADEVKTVTVDDIKNYMRDLLDQNNYRVIILDPKETAK